MKTVIFDFDGTLADGLRIMIKVYNELAEVYNFNKITNVQKVRGMGAFRFWWHSGVSIFKIPLLLRKGRTLFRKEAEHLKLFPGIKGMLRDLKKNCHVGILTSNSKKTVVECLKRNGLDDVFDFIYAGSSLFGKRKVLKKVMRQNGLDASEVVYVGDETRDIRAAKKAGVKIISVGWGFNTQKRLRADEPDALVVAPKDLVKTINRIGA